MTDIRPFLTGSSFSVQEITPDPPDIQLIDAIRKSGILPPDEIIFDGKIHRFDSGTKDNSTQKTGWYVAYDDGFPSGCFGCWRSNFQENWTANIGRESTPAELEARRKRNQEMRQIREAELAKSYEMGAQKARYIWSKAPDATADHGYLKRKGIRAHNAKISYSGRLIVPLFSELGEISSLQFIDEDGSKNYLLGGKARGQFWMIGNMDECGPGVLYLAEGFATAATIYEATGRPCAVAYSAGNLPLVAGHLRKLFGESQNILIVADNDSGGAGKNSADQAVAKHNVRSVMIPILGDANDFQKAGNDLKYFLEQLDADENLLFSWASFDQAQPIPWIIKKWIPAGSTGMLFGDSGVGKSFIAVDIACSIVTGRQWQGCKTKQGKVAYLAGEGHLGMNQRIKAWAQLNGYQESDIRDHLMISKRPVTIDDPGMAADVLWQMKRMTEDPISLIVIDTLNRHMGGEENNQRDIRALMNACGTVAEKMGAAVLLVHHTGHADMKGKTPARERGASAIRASLDISILASKADESDKTIKLSCVKVKDAARPDPVYCELVLVDFGWIDEDGDPVDPAAAVRWVMPEEKPMSEKVKPEHITHLLANEAQRELTKQEQMGWDAYAHAAMNHGRLTVDGLFDGVEISAWRAEFYERMEIAHKKSPKTKGKPLTQGAKQKAMRRVIDAFFAGGFLSHQVDPEGDFYWPIGEGAFEQCEKFALALKMLHDMKIDEEI